jgi:hypothetical protein
VDDGIGGVYIYAPTPDGRQRRVVLVPHYGRPVPAFYIIRRARANVRIVLDGTTLSLICDVAWIRDGAELFWCVIRKSTTLLHECRLSLSTGPVDKIHIMLSQSVNATVSVEIFVSLLFCF